MSCIEKKRQRSRYRKNSSTIQFRLPGSKHSLWKINKKHKTAFSYILLLHAHPDNWRRQLFLLCCFVAVVWERKSCVRFEGSCGSSVGDQQWIHRQPLISNWVVYLSIRYFNKWELYWNNRGFVNELHSEEAYHFSTPFYFFIVEYVLLILWYIYEDF